MMDEKMRAAFDAWLHDRGDAGEGRQPSCEVVEWTLDYLRTQQEPVAYGMPNTAITGKQQAMMLVRPDLPSDDQYSGALWVPLYANPVPPSVPDPMSLISDDDLVAAMQGWREFDKPEKIPSPVYGAMRAALELYRAKLLAAAPKQGDSK